METRPLGDFLPDEGLAIVAQFKTDVKHHKYHGMHYLDIHRALREKLQLYEHYVASKGMPDIDYFVLVILGEIGIKIPEEYFA